MLSRDVDAINAQRLGAAVLDGEDRLRRVVDSEALRHRECEPEPGVQEAPPARKSRGRDEIFGFIKEMHENLGITILLVSHSMEDIAKLVKRVIVMNKGGIEMDGKVSDIFDQPEALEKIGLSSPQISYLMKRLKKLLPEMEDNVYTVRDARDVLIKHLIRRESKA